MNSQIRKLGYFMMVLFLILFGQVNNIQVLQASKLTNDPRNNRNAVRDFASQRGAIQTADGVVIANSVPVDDDYKYLRQYPKGELYSGITGFFSFTYGNEGIEKTYNKELTGKTYALTNIDDLLKDRVTTNNVTLTVSDKLQQVTKDALGNNRGAAIALDPKTGAVLSMYSNPTYDPNALAGHDFPAVTRARDALLKDKANPMLPRAYRESYPPGSTFKVVTSSAAYDTKPELVTKSYPALSALPLPNSGGRSLRNFGGEVCGGKLPDLLRVSCNSGFGQMGIDLGAANLNKQASDFGFNSTPPLDQPAVAKSIFPSVDFFRRNTPQLAYSAIGQGSDTATPLQMALVASAIANNGIVMSPHLMKEIRNSHGDIVKKSSEVAWKRATTSDTAKKMTANMVEVVKRGTATAAAIPGVQVAGKTGTAETADNRVNAWFVAFAPADDPKVAVAVIVEDQVGFSDATGGRVAAPIAKKIMTEALAEAPKEPGK